MPHQQYGMQMKELFHGFYGPTQEETSSLWGSENSVFVFDTNALLLLYRCERETREAFFSQWEKVRERVWLPYHVCLEYQRNRLSAIKEHVMELKNAGRHISQRVSEAGDLDNFEKDHKASIFRYDSLKGKFGELSNKLNSIVDEFVEQEINNRVNEADFLTNHDTVRDRISDLAQDRIGTAPSQDDIESLQKIGKERYSKEIPPGFEDAKKKKGLTFTFDDVTYESQYGDWFIWNEILDLAAEKTPDSVIFVTNDAKPDWVFRVGGQVRGPLESLKTELAKKGNGTQFFLYTSASFLIAANKYLTGSPSSDAAIEEIARAAKPSTNIIKDAFPIYESWSKFKSKNYFNNINDILNLNHETINKNVNKIMEYAYSFDHGSAIHAIEKNLLEQLELNKKILENTELSAVDVVRLEREATDIKNKLIRINMLMNNNLPPDDE